jgi:hypothetical protein
MEELSEQLLSEKERLRELSELMVSRQQRQASIQKEVVIFEEEAKKREKRLYNLKSDDAFRVLMREIQNLKKGKKMLEEEALQLEEDIPRFSEEIQMLTSRVEQLEKEYHSKADSVEKECQGLLAELERASSQIERLKEQLTPECVRHYELIRSSSLLPIVAPVRNGTCYGCCMNIPPQLFNRVQANRDVIVCPSCHRILYFDKNGELDLENEEVMLSMSGLEVREGGASFTELEESPDSKRQDGR